MAWRVSLTLTQCQRFKDETPPTPNTPCYKQSVPEHKNRQEKACLSQRWRLLASQMPHCWHIWTRSLPSEVSVWAWPRLRLSQNKIHSSFQMEKFRTPDNKHLTDLRQRRRMGGSWGEQTYIQTAGTMIYIYIYNVAAQFAFWWGTS